MGEHKKTLFPGSIPLWALILLLIVLCSVFALLLYAVSNQVYSYTVQISQNGSVDISNFTYGSHPELENAAFFQQIRDEFVAQKASFIEADLSAMQLRLYEKGKVVYDVPILTKGKEGSWWETPAGLYKAQGKEENHFSSFGRVYMPSSIPFQGNFFIHGWPYHPDGTPVESTFSGGCIRLSTEDAGKIYDAISVGTPILVHEADFAPDNFTYQGKLPNVTASNILVADLKSNFVLMQKNSKDPVPVASITKLLTSIIATEYINIEKEITVPQQAIITTTKPRLKAGQQVSVYSLLYPLLEESSNEAAETLTYFLGPNYYMSLMNEKAQALGMPQTHFADASGLSPENISTAEDLFNLAKYMYNNRGFLLGVSAGRVERADLYGTPAFSDLKNFNLFANDPAFVGGKIGKTDAAQETFIGIFEFDVRSEQRPIAVILLGSQDIAADTQRILGHIRTTYADTQPAAI
jgi:hypothetical protein